MPESLPEVRRVEAGPFGHPAVEHDWPQQAGACRALQNALSTYVNTVDDLPPVRRLGGVDIGFEDGGRITRAAAVVLDAQTLEDDGQLVDQGDVDVRIGQGPEHAPGGPGGAP